MGIAIKPEILPPRPSIRESGARNVFDDEHLDQLSHLLDDFLRIPGTPIRFGLDGIVGFIPGVGDILGGLASSIIIVAAWFRGVPPITIARMVMNVAIETAVGSVPVVGNLFDIGWRANRRNYKLLEGSIVDPRRHSIASWLYFGVIGLALLGLALVPVLVLGWVLVHLKALLVGGST
jgi:hypothetical protein